MDALKMALRLSPYCDATLLQRVLQLALDARMLDVAASPYDATQFGVGVVAVETKEGRAQYRQEQAELMHRAKPIREELLRAYDLFIAMAFAEDMVGQADPERFATTQPGGLPWRRNLLQSTTDGADS